MNQRFFFLYIYISVLLLSACQHTANNDSWFNLNFEDVEYGMPLSWSVYSNQPDYAVSLDSVTVKSGKYSMVIEFTGNAVGVQGIRFALPYNYNGEKITLSGYVKTENVSDGFAGLRMQLDPKIPFDYMLQHEVSGTTDWKKYEITLDMYPEQTEQICVGGLLYGRGKMWIDDLKIEIDGKDIRKVKPYMPEFFPAELDKEFDRSSTIEFQEVNEQKIEDLELLGKIWGFLKYHHPAIAKGNYNWDNELFRMLPSYLNTNDNDQRDKLLIEWISQYGRILKCGKCITTPGTALIKPDNSWIECSNISLKLKEMLRHIYLNRNQGTHYYIRLMPVAGNPVFTNEINYEGSENPDAGFRLLALYRYWNMIHYFFPSKYLTDKDWNDVLKEYIPYFMKTQDRLEYELTASTLIGEICDTHAMFQRGFKELELTRGNKQVSVNVRFIGNKLVVTECYNEDVPLKRGDIITHIDGESVEDIVDSVKKYYPASNEAAKLRNIADDLLRSNKLSIHINYLSSGVTGQKEIYLSAKSQWVYDRFRKEDTDKHYRFIDKDIGYITLENIKEEDIPVIKKEFMNTKGIIIDIRNDPAFFGIIHRLAPYFVRSTTPFVKFTTGNPDNPGEFIFKGEYKILQSESENIYQGKVVVLVNEESQSLAEFITMALQAGDNTTVIGSQTAGADGFVSEIVLPGGLKTMISGIGVYYPDGRETQRIGIVPDIEVKPTIKGIREGRDEVMEKAIEIIRQEKNDIQEQ